MRIALLDDYQDVAGGLADWSRLPPGAELTIFRDHLAEEDALVERLHGFDVVGVMRERTPFDRALIARLPNLRLLVTTGKQNAAIDLTAAAEHGVCVCGTGSLGFATAELTMTLMLAMARNLVAETRSVAEGGWQIGLGEDLRGATLGLAGLGRLGVEVARMAQAFGMRVIAWSMNLDPAHAAEHDVEAVSKDRLLAESDYLSLHLRLSERSQGVFGAEDFARMRPTARLINTSRAGLVDTAALVAALDAGRLAGAALDVFDEEPLPADSPLRRHPRLLLTPHVGYVTRPSYELYYEGILEAIQAFAQGAPVRKLTP